MKQEQQRLFDSFRRVQDFLDAHSAEVGGLNQSTGRKTLDDVVTQIAAQETAQGSANLTMAGQINRERSLRADLQTRHMVPISVFARARLRGAPDFAALTKAISGLSSRALVRAARAMASAAAPYATEFQQGGLPTDTIQALSNAATTLDGAIVERANVRVGRVKATQGIVTLLEQGTDAVGVLNAAMMRQFAGDPTFLSAWRAARRVMAKQGAIHQPRRTKTTAAVGGASAATPAVHAAPVVPTAPAVATPEPDAAKTTAAAPDLHTSNA